MKKVPVRFGANDIIICHFNPFKKTLQFTKKSSNETCTLNVDTIPNDKLYPCIRISYAQDTVEYIQQWFLTS
jgi:predicted metal-dependent phosphotriesterase family hydrolase